MAKRKKSASKRARPKPVPSKPPAKTPPAKSPVLVKSVAAASVSQQPVQKNPDWLFWAAIITALIVASGMLFISFSGRGEAVVPLKSEPAQKPQASAPPANIAMATPIINASTYDHAYFQGNESARVIIVEYSDFECPYCADALPALFQVKQDYPSIKFVYRHYPLSLHPDAQKAAEAAECAGLQGKFWEMHNKLFANQGSLSASSLKDYASGLALDTAESSEMTLEFTAEFNSCLDSGKTAKAVAWQAAEAAALGARATPTFLVFSINGSDDETQARVRQEAQTLAARYAAYSLPVSAVQVQGAGLGLIFAGALPYSDFAEVLGVFGESPRQGAQ